jgi:hypothetical protein
LKKKIIAIAAVILAIVIVMSLGITFLNSKPVQGSNAITASDDSMAPTIKNNAIVTFDRNINFSDVKVNDIVVFHQAHQAGSFIGRAVNVSSYGLVLKGDNKTSAFLGYITAELYVGKVVQINNP